jgi:hypothetical protein
MKPALKSKTLHFNLWAPVVYALLSVVGVAIPVSLPVVLIAGNSLLRVVTKEPVTVTKPKKKEAEDA